MASVAAASTVAMNSCRKTTRRVDESLTNYLKIRVKEFFDAPIKEHKDCFVQSWNKMIEKVSLETASAKDALASSGTTCYMAKLMDPFA